MLPPEVYGPAGALVALAFVVAALMRGDLVPGWVYRREAAGREKAETQAERNSESLSTMAKAIGDKPGPVA
jgi:hypothetical protein